MAASAALIGLLVACASADVVLPRPASETAVDGGVIPVAPTARDTAVSGNDAGGQTPPQDGRRATAPAAGALGAAETPTTLAWPTAVEIVAGLSIVYFPAAPGGWNPSPTATWPYIDLPDYVFPTIAWPTATPPPATATPPPTASATPSITVSPTLPTATAPLESVTPEEPTATGGLPTGETVPSTPTETASPTTTPPPLPASVQGRIAFSVDGDDDGKAEIYVVQPPWLEAKRVVPADRDQLLSDWLVPGDLILFESREPSDGGPALYRIAIDGADLRPLPAPGTAAGQGKWSPDGSEVVFVGSVDGQGELFVVDAEEGEVHRLTEMESDESAPDWSPDGQQLVFISTREGSPAVHRVNRDGSGVERITSSNEPEHEPAWSPLGGTIAFVRSEVGGDRIWLIPEDGSGGHALADVGNDVGSLAWSPDGRWLAFVADSGEGSDVFIVGIDGGEVFRLTASLETEQGLTWVP